MTGRVKRWVLRPGDREFRLVCIPFAGGSAHSYVRLAREVPAGWTVIAAEPQRIRRDDGTPATDFAGLVDEYARVLAGDLCGPGLLYGHSMGALAALGVARRLGTAWPVGLRLVLSALQPPHRMATTARHWAAMNDGDLLDIVVPLGALPATHPDRSAMLRHVISPFRYDIAIVASHPTDPARTAAPAVPTTVLSARGDAVATPELVREAADAIGARDVRTVAGDHMHVLHEAAATAAALHALAADTNEQMTIGREARQP